VVPKQSAPVASPKPVSPPPSAVVPKQPAPVASPKQAMPPRDPALISLHADDLDVRKALEMISRQAKVNILVSSSVSGTVTLDLRDKTLDDVLDAIVRLCHLVVRRDKDVLYVSTVEELRKGEDDNLPVRVYHLNYVKSDDVATMITPLLTTGKGVMSASPKSEVGIKTDTDKAGGNSMAGGEIVVVRDYEQVLKTVDRVIAQIDVQPIQVLIEAVIVQVTLTKDMELGINYAVLDGAGKTLAVFGDGTAVNAAAGFTPASVLTTTGAVTAGFADNSNGVKFGWVGGPTSAFVKALETFGETKVLACPRILVLNKMHAEIQLGDRLGYQTTTQTQTSTVQTVNFIDVGTLLRLRPFVSSDGVIRMEIHPERSSGELNLQGVPQTHNAQVTSNVMIPNGCTVVIGGLIDSDIEKKWEGLPYLSRIPVIGNMFRHTVDTALKKELVVILTPHVWQPNCPDALNYLGRPRTLGLDERTSQTNRQENRDGGSCYELVRPESCPSGAPLLPAGDAAPQ
jgi:type IV pilus secretin PilQ/predicted competence protein